ncbi:ATP-binding cassette domain-containing protein [Mesoplasma lactucae]|uniref:Uncharacterized protein n=1 Tax=Mesoplasma lactucae ATCC 49193 TaxID=81460 RepID=A0A291IR40_9MOLU|nr:ABC transporter ATP-binding protein [Mesoplasma lactucae]ATG97204.1 hypothetical protein CP520_00290 [Mesoplasma lactucae ATCC 49193]ATZ20354.1 ABC transporter ATP-binding protein [Mesoplasma lactucae ATCC 49193]MCL8216525.1 L-cystine import ATP-binding protein TcyC [Mesoplasma lactucae ATCC 49193]
MPNNKLILKDIKKSFSKKEVLKDININFESGKVYGLLGNNGAGKTTLVRILFNEIKPDGGSIQYTGQNQASINYDNWYYFTENHDLPLEFSTYEFLWTDAMLAKISEEEFKKRLESAQKIIPINFDLKTKIKKLSSGQKKMVSCLAALICKPKVIFLDEPTANLDQENKGIIVDLINALKNENRIIVVITHLIKEIQDSLTDVVIIDDGIVKKEQKLTSKDDAYQIFQNTIKTGKPKIQKTKKMEEFLNG